LASFGEQLRQAREARQMTLPEISAATKISRRALQALEEDQFDQLPGGIFNKGFVRAYARYVGLDEEKTIAEYLVASKTEEEPVEATQSEDATAEVGGKGLQWMEEAMRSPALSGIMPIRVLAVVVALALGWFWWMEHRAQVQARPPVNKVAAPAAAPAAAQEAAKEAAKGEEGAASAPETSGVAAESAKDAAQSTQQASSSSAAPAAETSATQAATQGKSPSSAAAQSPAPPAAEEKPTMDAEAPVQVTIAATEKSWIRVFSDQKEVETLTMDPDDPKTSRRSYSAQEKLKVVAGYPEGLTVTYNGKAAGELGRDGQPITIIVTPSGLKTFLAKSP